jgi:hypothetical protein
MRQKDEELKLVSKLSNMVNPRKLRPVGSNTDSGSKSGVYCKNTTTSYLAFIVRNLSKYKYKYNKNC